MSLNEPKKSPPSLLSWIGGLMLVCVVLLLCLHHSTQENQDSREASKDTKRPAPSLPTLPPIVRHNFKPSPSEPESAEAIVARKLTQFGQKQRAIFEAMAAKRGVAVSDDVKRFFDAIEAGHWDEAKALYQTLRDPNNPAGSSIRRYSSVLAFHSGHLGRGDDGPTPACPGISGLRQWHS